MKRQVIWWILFVAMLAWWVFVALFMTIQTVRAECRPVEVTINTPTGIAGCEVWGEGTGSWYGSNGYGVAMNFCTWGLRHSTGCGSVNLTSVSTGLTVVVPVIDFCDCYTGTSRQRIVDMLPGVIAALGLDPSLGLYPVVVIPASATGSSDGSVVPIPRGPVLALPDTAMR